MRRRAPTKSSGPWPRQTDRLQSRKLIKRSQEDYPVRRTWEGAVLQEIRLQTNEHRDGYIREPRRSLGARLRE